MTIEHPFLMIGTTKVFLDSAPPGTTLLDTGVFDPNLAEKNAHAILRGEYPGDIGISGLTISFLIKLYSISKNHDPLALSEYQTWKSSILALTNPCNTSFL